jgi:hypothetical protein
MGKSPAAPSLRVEIDAKRRALVSYKKRNGETISRTIELPDDDERAVETIALLAGNLARDEADELLAEIERSRRARAAPEPDSPDGQPEEVGTPEPPSDEQVPRETSPSAASKPEPSHPSTLKPSIINLTLAHPITILPDTHERVLNVELGLAYSRVGAIEGVGLNLLVHRVEQHAHGFVFGGFYSEVRGTLQGVQTGFGLTRAGSVEGAELGGIVSWVEGPVQGLQATTVVGRAAEVEGAQLAGAVALSDGVRGLQAGGVTSIARGPMRGVELAGAVNVAPQVKGAALAGAANVVGDVEGVAVSAVNIAERVQGATVGIVNVMDTLDGLAVGIINIAGDGRIEPMLWASNVAPLSLALKFVAGVGYTEIGIGYNPGADEYVTNAGIGAHVRIGSFVLEPGAHYSSVHGTDRDIDAERYQAVVYRGRVQLDLTPALSIFGGGGARHRVTGEAAGRVEPEIFGGISVPFSPGSYEPDLEL